MLTCSYGCGEHTDAQNMYHALDFDKPNIPEGNCEEPATLQPVVAPAAGIVTFAADNGGFGYSVKIDAGGGYVIMLSHMCPTLTVLVGRYVLRGEQVDWMSRTGGDWNDHIHMQVYYNNQCLSTVPESKPEPMSGYTDWEGREWQNFMSDNYASFARASRNSSSSTYVDSTMPDVAVDSLAQAHVVWREDSATPGVYYSICTESGCTTSGLISVASGGTAPAVAVDSSDNLHLAWNNSGRIYYSKYNGSSWSTPVEISTGTQNQYLDIAVDAANRPHVVWFLNPYSIYYNYFNGTSWLASPERVDTTGNALYPAIAVISDDTPQVVREYRQSGNYEIYYSYRIGSNLWAAARNISNSATYSYSPDVVDDSTSILHVVWKEASGVNDIFYSQGIGTSWDTPVNIANTRYDSGYPAVSVDAGDNPHVVWNDASDGNWEIFYTRWDGLNWTYRRNISSTVPYYSTYPAIAVDENSTPHVVWQEERPPWYYRDIYYRQ